MPHRLKEEISTVMDRAIAGELIDAQTEAARIYECLPPEDQFYVGVIGVRREIDGARRKLRVRSAQAKDSQLSLFDLPAVVPLDSDGRKLKSTRDLTEDEFLQMIRVRRDGIAADIAQVKLWEEAFDACKLHWARHPGMSFGQILDLLTAPEAAA